VLLALMLAAAIGLSLSLLGGGGSIITVPVLVYAAHQSPQNAVVMSLAVVGAVSAISVAFKARSGLVHWQAVLTFGVAGMLGALLGAQGTPLVPANVLLLIFAALMLAVALNMWFRPQPTVEPSPECQPTRCVLAGFGVGAVTGFLGVGGGFLLVPALTVFARLPLRMAVGTSLAIIALNSLAGFLAHLRHWGNDWALPGLFFLFTLVGMTAGLPLAKRISPAALNRGFALFVAAVAVFVIVRNLLG